MLNLAKLEVGWDKLWTLLPGDLVSVATPESLLSRLIRGMSRREGESPTWASHSGVIAEQHGLVIEALWTVKRRSLFDYQGKSQVCVFRAPFVSPGRGLRIADAAANRLGQKYGWWKILQHAHGRAARIARNDRQICSQLVAECYAEVCYGFSFGVEPNEAQPDDLLDYAVGNNWLAVWADSQQTVSELAEIYDAGGNEFAEELKRRHSKERAQ